MKRKNLAPLWRILKLELKTSPLFFGWTVFYSAFTGLSPIVTAFLSAKLITSVTSVAFKHTSATPVYQWLILIAVFEVLGSLLAGLNSMSRRRYQQLMDIVVSSMLFTKTYQLSQEQFDDQEFNTKFGRAKDALNQLWRLSDELSLVMSAIISFVVAITAITVVSPLIGGIIILSVVPAAIFRVRQNRSYEEVYKKIEPYERVAYRSRWMLLDPNMMPEVRLVNAFGKLMHSWQDNARKAQDMIYNVDKRMLKLGLAVDVLQPLVDVIANVYFFRMLVAQTLGLDRFLFLRGIIQQASFSAASLASSIDQLHELTINLQNFAEIQDTPPAIPDGDQPVVQPLTSEFKDVSFTYPGTDSPVLKNVSFVIAPGSRLALVGENGAGKSTLLKLLLRQYVPTTGQITINGVDIRNVKQADYLSAMSNLSQDFMIVNHLTVRDNLVIGLEKTPSDDKIHEALKLVHAQKFVDKMPHKLSQRLDASFDDGTGLSGGQRQRLGIARALLRGGDVMILDEPTSAIDAKAEYEIFNNIYGAHSGKTTLIVSHRFSTVRKADKIIVMQEGKITEYGSHEELLKHNGLYKEMFETQAEGYK